MEEKLDPYGLKGISQDYELSRPRYPSTFIEKALKQLSCLKNYLDVASGPGILFYEIAPNFTGTLVVNDRSKTQLGVAKEKLRSTRVDPLHVEFVESDVFDIHHNLSKPTKFDLITIAQALQFLDQKKFCEYVIENLLAENGILCVLGYFCDQIKYNYPGNSEFAESAQLHYEKCYSTILPYYDSDREALHKCFAEFDFKKYFNNFERVDCDIQTEISLENFVKYQGTSSGYNLYKKKFSGQPEYQDPIELMKINMEKDLQSFCQEYNVEPKDKSLVMKVHFFMISLSEPKKTL